MKKIKIIALCALCLLVGGGVYLYTNQYKEVTLTQEQIEEYDKFKLAITENTTKSDILELCELVETLTIAGNEWFVYESEELQSYLYNYEEMIGISGEGDMLIVQYITTDNESILLEYTDLGYRMLGAYDEKKDTSVEITTQEGILTKNFSNRKIEGLED